MGTVPILSLKKKFLYDRLLYISNKKRIEKCQNINPMSRKKLLLRT